MILDTRERLKFMEYCKSQADSCKAIAEQLEKNCAHVLGDQVGKRERSKAAAYCIVAMELAAVEEEYTVGREDIGDVEDIQ